MSLYHLILGLLNDEKLSGYDLNKKFDQAARHFWTTDQSQIYRALHKMLERGWVDVEVVVQDDNPNKKVYSLTRDGRDELRQWVTTPILDDTVRESWLGQIHFGAVAEIEQILPLLNANRDEIVRRLRDLEAIASAVPDVYQYADHMTDDQVLRLLTLEYGLAIHRTALDWVDKAIALIQRRVEQAQKQSES